MTRLFGHRSAELVVPCLYRLARPREIAKALGMPKRWSVTEGASGEQVLRATRCSLDIRQWARCRRVNGPLVVGAAGEAEGAKVTGTV